MKKSVLKTTIALVLAILLTVPTIFAVQLPQINSGVVDSDQNSLIGRVLGLIQGIAVAIALGMLIIIGIQYVTATGEKKGQIKDTAINYLFGAVCIFAAVVILQGIKSLVDGIGTTATLN